MRAFEAIEFTAIRPGPRLIVTGAVHGNETCGTRAIRRVLDDIAHERLTISAGAVTFVPVTNPLAYARGERQGDRNLNRRLLPTSEPREFEDHVANWLCPLLSRHDGLLDLHSFHTGGEPFVMVGPPDNQGELEPFAQARTEVELAVRLGVRRIVDGWLDAYASGVRRRRERAAPAGGGASLDLDPDYGVGTTEYMRRVGGWGLTLECGQHDDPRSPEVAYLAILRTLAHLRLIDAPTPVPIGSVEALRLVEVIDREHDDDRFVQAWRSFDAVPAGAPIAVRRGGQALAAPFDGRIVFPNPRAAPGQEWYYLAQPHARFDAAAAG